MFEIAELSLTYSQYQGLKRKIHFIYTNIITMTCLFGKNNLHISEYSINRLSEYSIIDFTNHCNP